MDSSLLGSPFLGWDEKHTKEREHAPIFQQQYDNCLASREQRERERTFKSRHMSESEASPRTDLD
ncbi:hypothetical protein AHAS_Ahas03G0094900 [Arachis hypogaea]